MKRTHYDLIIAWANGAHIEQLHLKTWESVARPEFYEQREYRIKPVAKPAAKPCPELMEEYLNELLYKAEKLQSPAIAYVEDILQALEPKEAT